LGQSVEVRVDDIDPQGKVSLSLASAPEEAAVAGSAGSPNGESARSTPGPGSGGSGSGAKGVSFEDAFEAELVADLGDLGPGASEPEGGRERGDRSNDRRSRGRSRRR
jgi:polyribonucleotide nucleotidyltransferase